MDGAHVDDAAAGNDTSEFDAKLIDGRDEFEGVPPPTKPIKIGLVPTVASGTLEPPMNGGHDASRVLSETIGEVQSIELPGASDEGVSKVPPCGNSATRVIALSRTFADEQDESKSFWRAHREEAVSELQFKFVPFLKSFLYEFLPSTAGGVLAISIDGYLAARNRALFPFKIRSVVYDDLPLVFVIVAHLCWRPAGINFYDLISVLLLRAGKALTVALKYSFFGDRDLDDPTVGLSSEAYYRHQRFRKNLMASLCLNLHGHQPAVLLEQLFASSVVEDCDLSKVFFQLESAAEAQAVWEEVSRMLEDAQKFDLYDSSEGGTYEKPEVPYDGSESYHGYWGSKYASVFSECAKGNTGLIQNMFQQTEHVMTDVLRRGIVPGHVLALHCIKSCHWMPKEHGARCLLSAQVWSLLLAVMPCCVDLSNGDPPFWTSPKAVAIAAVQAWLFYRAFTAVLFYAACRLKFFWSQYHVDAYLLGIIAGDLRFVRLPMPAGQLCQPHIDMSLPKNMASWAGLQRVLRGSSFAPNFQCRFSYYCAVTVGVIVLDASLHRAAALHDPETVTTGSKLASTLRMVSLALILVLELLIGYVINAFTQTHASELYRRRVALLAAVALDTQASGCARGGPTRDGKLLAANLLEAAAVEVVHQKPVKVGLLTAHLGRMSLIASVVSLVIYEDLLVLQAQLGYGGGSSKIG